MGIYDNKKMKDSISEFTDRILKFQKFGWGSSFIFPVEFAMRRGLPECMCDIFHYLLQDLYNEGILEFPPSNITVDFNEEKEKFEVLFEFGK